MNNCKYFLIFIALLMVGCSSDSNKITDTKVHQDKADSSYIKIGIQMEKSGGVYRLPCNINGVKMNFIFDTGASNVCISLTEAMFLYKNGFLEDEDILGKKQSRVADGSIVENMEINLHCIEIEGIMITDVKALVTRRTDAPLLLGQSAIQKLGKIEMKGDSLFIYKKSGVSKNTITKDKNKDNAVSVESLPNPNWWDNIKTFFGCDSKMQKYLDKSRSAYNKDLIELAEKYADYALECDSGSWKPYAILGFVAYYENDYQSSVSAYEKYCELNKSKETLYLLEGKDSITYKESMQKLAFAYLGTCYYKKTIQIVQEVIEADPTYYRIFDPMITAYCKLKQYEKAIFWSRKILESNTPEDKEDGYFCLAYIADEQGRTSEAIRLYEKVIEINPNNSGALNNLSNFYPDESSYVIELRKKAARLGNENSANWLKRHRYNW